MIDTTSFGPRLFRVESSIHQKFVKEREKLTSADAIAKSVDAEVRAVRENSSNPKFTTYNVLWDPTAWNAAKEDMYKGYLQQRYQVDDRFRAMIDAIKARKGRIMFVNGADASDLGVGVRIDGSVAGGENKIGTWMMELGS